MRKLFILALLLACSAMCFGQGWYFSNYTQTLGTVATPTFDNDTGTYSGSVTITPSDSTSGAGMVTCTTSASCTPMTTYSTPITFTGAGTYYLCVVGTKTNWSNSTSKCATYTVVLATGIVQAKCSRSTGTSIPLTFTSTPSAGNSLYAFMFTANNDIMSIRTTNDTFALKVGPNTLNGGGGVGGEYWAAVYSVDTIVGGTNSATVTFTSSASETPIWCIAELSNAGSSSFDSGIVASGTTTSGGLATSTAITTTAADKILSLYYDNGGWVNSWSAGTGYTNAASDTISGATLEGSTGNPSAGTVTATATSTHTSMSFASITVGVK